MIRAVLDAHIVARGILNRSRSNAVKVFEAGLKGDFLPVTSRHIIEEIKKTLGYIRRGAEPSMTRQVIEEALEEIEKNFVIAPGKFKLRQIVPKDAKDNPLFEAAIETDCGHIVTDDKPVLNVKNLSTHGYRIIEVWPPSLFLKRLKAES